MVVTRFLPTPDGPLHLGNLYVALLNQEFSRCHRGVFHVQIDDLTTAYPLDEVVDEIVEDLDWLRICERNRVRLASQDRARYLDVIDELAARQAVEIVREQRGCCVVRVDLLAGGDCLPIRHVRASSCRPGEVGYLPFASDPRHVLDRHEPAFLREFNGLLLDTYWCSDPRESEPWLEVEIDDACSPDLVRITYWLPRPLQVEVLASASDGVWRSVAHLQREPERTPMMWDVFHPSRTHCTDLLALDANVVRGSDRLRLCFKGMQPGEAYRLSFPHGEAEPFFFDDVCQGAQVVVPSESELLLCQLRVPIADSFFGTTHVIRGSELLEGLSWYMQCMHLLGRPIPVFCHIPVVTDETGVKLSKKLTNGSRIAAELRRLGMSPQTAREWIIENAYSNSPERTHMHSFETQLGLLSATL